MTELPKDLICPRVPGDTWTICFYVNRTIYQQAKEEMGDDVWIKTFGHIHLYASPHPHMEVIPDAELRARVQAWADRNPGIEPETLNQRTEFTRE